MFRDKQIPGPDAPPASRRHRLQLAAEHVIEPHRRRVVVKFGHKLTPQDLARYANLLRSNPDFDPAFSEIIDLRQVEELDFQADDFLKLADEVDPFSPQARRAFVVRTSIQQHAARMHKVLRSQRNIEIFHSLEDAERWLES